MDAVPRRRHGGGAGDLADRERRDGPAAGRGAGARLGRGPAGADRAAPDVREPAGAHDRGELRGPAAAARGGLAVRHEDRRAVAGGRGGRAPGGAPHLRGLPAPPPGSRAARARRGRTVQGAGVPDPRERAQGAGDHILAGAGRRARQLPPAARRAAEAGRAGCAGARARSARREAGDRALYNASRRSRSCTGGAPRGRRSAGSRAAQRRPGGRADHDRGRRGGRGGGAEGGDAAVRHERVAGRRVRAEGRAAGGAGRAARRGPRRGAAGAGVVLRSGDVAGVSRGGQRVLARAHRDDPAATRARRVGSGEGADDRAGERAAG
jgi:hypothetical protein